MFRGRPFGVSLIAVLLAGPILTSSSPAATSQAAQDQPPPQPTFRTEVNYVRVDVYPTRDQMPVTDLTQDDFEVFDNGTPQKIEQFERVVIRAAGPQELCGLAVGHATGEAHGRARQAA